MGKEVTVYFILLLTFTIGSIYNFRIRKQSIYPVRPTKPRVIIMILSPLIFLSILYYINENFWGNYVLAILASVFIISAIVGEGIHEEGIYYHSSGINFLFAKLVKWEDIRDMELDIRNKS